MSSADASGNRTTTTPRAIVAAGARFFWRNRVYVVRDLLVALVWVLALTAVFVVYSPPSWLYYVLLLGGLLCYSLAVSLLGVAAKLNR